MNDEHLTRFFSQRPFEPFTMYLSDGRSLLVKHPEQASIGMYAASVVYSHLDDSIEFIDATHIVTFRTLLPADPHSYI
jgi:hypothetical protein